MCQRGRNDTAVLSGTWGCLGGHGIPGSKLNVSENSPKGEEECLTVEPLGFGVTLPKFKSRFCHLLAVWHWKMCLSSSSVKWDSARGRFRSFL